MSDPRPPEPAPVSPAIRVSDVGKCYQLYARPVDRLKQALWRGRRTYFREFWALRHVSFEVQPGEAVGIIGRNGSGKSTLLQIIAGTLRPAEGQVEVRGRVAALLELGSGFNMEFTGRENVYLNGSVLGLSIAEIDRRFDEIAAFADIGEFIDMAVKTYSTGMLVRLAFAVQAMLEPDILIVDEALAVGDAAFQIKCMKRIERLLERGVSVLLVTHDVNSVRTLCSRAVWLEEGRLRQMGEPREVTSRYLELLLGPSAIHDNGTREESPASDGAQTREQTAAVPACLPELHRVEGRAGVTRWGSGQVRVVGFAMQGETSGGAPVFELGERLWIDLEVGALEAADAKHLGVAFTFRNQRGLDIINFTSWDAGIRLDPLPAGQTLRVRFELDNILAPGEYALVLVVEEVRGTDRQYMDFVENALMFRVVASRHVFSAVLPEVRFRVMGAAPSGVGC
jgi:ABC-type polysaccharide/polyol phosphate transport system ATPase subunit